MVKAQHFAMPYLGGPTGTSPVMRLGSLLFFKNLSVCVEKKSFLALVDFFVALVAHQHKVIEPESNRRVSIVFLRQMDFMVNNLPRPVYPFSLARFAQSAHAFNIGFAAPRPCFTLIKTVVKSFHGNKNRAVIRRPFERRNARRKPLF